ncbi:Peptide chain release factor 1-like, mitochondrial [Triplophysa tibetana]|uniref:Peptide chain release factor 1-like, mitochondrial n=1 Tax=Triplophysa tibetana TaxID=1572043 RepID=A0A5A9P8P4_9TELE|nr:Peptide chain release factor 1-like, mitochondrial [Triplophysa tibetana]
MVVGCFRKSLSCASRLRTFTTHTRDIRLFIKRPAIHRTVKSTLQELENANPRSFHTSHPAMVTKILTVDEIFSKKSLHDFLKKKEMEYISCLEALNTDNQTLDEEEMKIKRNNLSVLAPLVQKMKELEDKQKDLKDTQELLTDNDPDMHDLAETESQNCLAAIHDIKLKILSFLIPEEESDMSDLVLEVTAGVGGQEAMLFTDEIFDMYQNFAAFNGWGFDVLEVMSSELGGVRNATASISGPLSYKKLKFEAGVHRVQRVPKTEKQGRMHTSTMTVAILPQPTEISFSVNPKDLRIETKRASGAGGQHVNTTDSAVRIVHLPTGIVSECQQERSQIKNKEKAMTLLRAKLYSARLEEETSKRYQARKVQIGTKGRSEKIRTYNFSQDRITDHRIGKTIHDVHGFLQGEELLEEMIEYLQQFSEQESLMDILKDTDYNQQ